MKETKVKVALLDHLGGGNLGDDATLDAVMDNIKRRWPHATVTAFSMNPDDTIRRHGIPCYPIRTTNWVFGYQPSAHAATFKTRLKTLRTRYGFLVRTLRAIHVFAFSLPRTCLRELPFLVASFRTLRTFDLLVISGGGQLTEKDGPWAFPYTIFKWVLLARLGRVRCVFLNVGAGPLSHWLSKLFTRRALLAADYVSFRDEKSQTLAREIGFKGRSDVYPDNAYNLDSAVPRMGRLAEGRQPVVGLGPMPYANHRLPEAKEGRFDYDDLISNFAAFGSWLSERSYSLALFGTDIGVDPLAINDLQVALRNRYEVSPARHDRLNSVHELLSRMFAMDYVVTCRFHGVVFAHLLNKPVLAISHHPKVRTLMEDIGLSDYCLEIRSFDADLLAEKFTALVNEAELIRSRMKATLARYRSQLNTQFDALFPGHSEHVCALGSGSKGIGEIPAAT